MQHIKTCTECTRKAADTRAQRRDTKKSEPKKENTVAADGKNPKKPGPAVQPTERLEMNMEDILELIQAHKNSAFELDVIANFISDLPAPESEGVPLDVFNASIARQIARTVWEKTQYRFM